MVQAHGTPLQALVLEQFGGGITSTINFELDIKKVEDPEGGSRAVITMAANSCLINPSEDAQMSEAKRLPLPPFTFDTAI
jgi:hypothetical protein